MRITGGELRSRKLLTTKSDGLRPATDRLRETMFDILSNLMEFEGAIALDLYAGTGSVGFETISRGASRVVFVEANPKVAEVLFQNANDLGIEKKCDIRITKVEKYLNLLSQQADSERTAFDIVYVDPPYAMNNATHQIVDKIISEKTVKHSGVICVEHSKKYSPPPSHLFRQKLFGSTILSFLKPELK